MFENDYFMRMIRDLARALAKVLFNKDSVMYELPQEMEYTAADDLYCRIQALLSQGKINEAENLLLDEMDPSDKRYQELVLDFYMKLNDLDDEYLEEHNYSREEVQQGLQSFAETAGVPIF